MNQKQFIYQGASERPSTFDLTWNEEARALPLILFIHGFKGYKDWGPFNLMAHKFAKLGFVVAKANLSHNGTTVEQTIDFPDLEAFGKNTFSKELYDVDVILNDIKTNEDVGQAWNQKDIYLLGHSRGGAIAMLYAAHHNEVNKVATWASVSNLENRFTKEQIEYWREHGVIHIPNARTNQQMPLYLDLLDDYEQNRDALHIETNVKRIYESKTPQLIIHGTEDETVGVHEAEDLNSWNPNANKHMIEGANHTFGGEQPWVHSNLPQDMMQAIEITSSFFKS